MRRACLLAALLAACAAAEEPAGGGGSGPPPLDVWPNAESCCNSDPWLAEHHEQIRRLEPRVLVLLFDNDSTPSSASALVNRLIAALAESSRDHGYEDPQAPVQLQYTVQKLVDLRDDVPPAGYEQRNSTRFPLTDHGVFGTTFNYVALYREPFTSLMDIRDGGEGPLDLCAALDRGVIHEVWLVLHGDDLKPTQSAPEVVEQKMRYDGAFAQSPLQSPAHCAGNGCDFISPWCGRSLRVLTVNAHRGPGCAMESLGHGVEWTAKWSGQDGLDAIPWFTTYFREFAGFDLHEKYGLPDFSLYDCKSAAYPGPRTMQYTQCRGPSGERFDGTVEDYVPVCGNVHWAPNGRHDYDLDSPFEVDSTCERWRQDGGEVRRFTKARIDPYRELADDCMGPFLVYWRQNWPGFASKARDDEGRPMRSFWPFLFY